MGGNLIGVGKLEDYKDFGALHPQFQRAKTATGYTTHAGECPSDRRTAHCTVFEAGCSAWTGVQAQETCCTVRAEHGTGRPSRLSPSL